jgi:hypothetical protein
MKWEKNKVITYKGNKQMRITYILKTQGIDNSEHKMNQVRKGTHSLKSAKKGTI